MAVNWELINRKAFEAFKKDGARMNVFVFEKESDNYNITDGKRQTNPPVVYETYGFLKNYETTDLNIMDPEDVELVFHPGYNGMPNLAEKENILIQFPADHGDFFKSVSIKATRPVGQTIIYRVRAKGTGSDGI
jgi:hypothetical protein